MTGKRYDSSMRRIGSVLKSSRSGAGQNVGCFERSKSVAMKKRAGEVRTLSGREDLTLRVPRVLKLIGEESKRNGTDRLSLRKIDLIIRSVRKHRRNRAS
jgi:hypothetical protein